MIKLSKKVERLRAVLLTKKQSEELIKNIKDLGDFNDEDKTLMENFKKIYQKGVGQLKVFIDLLEELGKKVDDYTITYYTTQLKNGPLRSFLSNLVKNKNYWANTPDILGTQGNLNRSTTQTPIALLADTAVNDASVVTINKLPGFVYSAYEDLTKDTNTIYKNNAYGSLLLDTALRSSQTNNMLELFDSSLRGVNSAPTNDQAHGSYMVADTTSWNNTQAASERVFGQISDKLGEETLRLYAFNKQLNLFDGNINTDVSTKDVVHYLSEYMSLGETKSVILSTDLIGNSFEYDEPRKFEFEIKGESKNTKLKLHTVQGQLGDTSKPKEEPITKD